jgi:succinate dehydrogenase/fumarate reductase flavoprotein subunit
MTPREVKTNVKSIMWDSAGPVRWEEGLKKGLDDMRELQEDEMPRLHAPSSRPLHMKEAVEAFHMAVVGEMILRSALLRRESRGGGHYRLDYQDEDNKNWLKNIVIKNVDGEMTLDTVPVEITRFQPSQHEGE